MAATHASGDGPAPKFFPPEKWPKPHYAIASMGGNHYYLSNYHVNDKIMCWGTVIEVHK